MFKEITSFAEENHSSVNMAIVAIMSHGMNGRILSSDGRSFSEEWILKQFNNQNCPSLIGKPKMFIFSACR
jgi:hypothetical protein